MDLILIAGLGNPGKQYAHTRHNVGWEVLDVLYEKLENPSVEKFQKGTAVRGMLSGKKVMLLKPLTYMNLSGEAVREALDYYKLDAATQLLVICDDVDLPTGHLRMRKEGSAGSHNGLKSIIRHLGNGNFARLRVGVGERADRREDLADHVLGHFSKEERELMEKAFSLAAEAAACFAQEGPEKAMTLYNTRRQRKKQEEEIPPEDEAQ